MVVRSLGRRSFLAWTTGTLTAAVAGLTRAEELPPVTDPRATDGDDRHEPNWDERLTITVGPDRGDMIGTSDKVLQAAVDYLARFGGGTVRILPGRFEFRNSVHLRSGTRLVGSGSETIITKIASETVELADDSNWFDQEITLQKSGNFRVGDGILLRAANPHTGGPTVIKRMLVARSGNRFKLNDGIRENLWLTGKPTCSSLFPLLTSEHTADVVIEDLALDGNRENNAHLDGNYGGCIFLQDCNRYAIRRVTTRNNHGDGISFQICHDVTVEDCHSHDNADLGVHPGSGSQRPVLRRNRLERNGIGIFWCWGVKYGLAEDNQIVGNRNYGVSIGHCDTDNVMRNNEIIDSGKVGILFRDENRGKDFWPNRNTVEKNRIINSGPDEGIGIDIQGKVRDLRITGNEIRETRAPQKRIGIRVGSEAQRLTLESNRIEGFATAMIDQRPATAGS